MSTSRQYARPRSKEASEPTANRIYESLDRWRSSARLLCDDDQPRSASITPVLEASSLSKKFDASLVVDEVSFRVEAGEVLGLLGANGAGKSTVIRMITALLVPTAGVVRFRGHPVVEDTTGYRSRMGYVPEEAHVYAHVTVREWLELVAELRNLPHDVRRARIPALLDALSMSRHEHATLGSCSKGQRQRTLFAAALLHDPDFLVLDEPLSGLDVDAALSLRALLSALAARGKAILVTSHSLDLVEKTCANVVVLDRGRVVASGPVETLRQKLVASSLEDVYRKVTSGGTPEDTARRVVKAMTAMSPE
jgi:ABC-2 type transport system ATP-binding protein